MHDPDDTVHLKGTEHLARLRRGVYAQLLLTHLTRYCGSFALWMLLFATLWGLGIHTIAGQISAYGVWFSFIIGCIYFISRDVRFFHRPTKNQINRILEQRNTLENRPLSSLDATLSNPETYATRHLWETYKARLQTYITNLEAPRLTHEIKHKNVTLSLIVIFIGTIAFSGEHLSSRIISGLLPFEQNSITAQKSHTFWITPPDYVRKPQIVLDERTAQPIDIIQGSTLKLHARKHIAAPSLRLGGRIFALNSDDQKHFEGVFTFNAQDHSTDTPHQIALRELGFPYAVWPYRFIADTAPRLARQIRNSEDNPEVLPIISLENGAIRIPLQLSDDFGVQSLGLHMTLDPVIDDDPPLGQALTLRRSISSPPATDYKVNPIYDLTDHPWAGLPVILLLTAYDHLGQQSETAEIKTTLPERVFRHPVSKKIVQIRKDLGWAPTGPYSNLVDRLDLMLMFPGEYQYDTVVTLALRSASSRLVYSNPTEQTARGVSKLLWETALRIEDGNLTLASRRLRDIQMKIENALREENIDQQELESYLLDLKDALREYFNALQEELQKQLEDGATQQAMPLDLLDHLTQPGTVDQMVKRLERALRDGKKQDAKDMMGQLQHLLDMLDPSLTAPLPDDMMAMLESVDELQALIDQQQDLRAQTHKQAEIYRIFNRQLDALDDLTKNPINRAPFMQHWSETPDLNIPPKMAPNTEKRRPSNVFDTSQNKAEQEALRYVLGQLMLESAEKLADIPKSMGLAERAMFSAAESLADNRPDSAVPLQDDAIKHLKEAQEDLNEQYDQRMQQMTGLSMDGGGRWGQSRRDPMGRPSGAQNGHGDGPGRSRVKIPNEQERKELEDLIETLREKSGDRSLPGYVLDYYKRLLDLF